MLYHALLSDTMHAKLKRLWNSHTNVSTGWELNCKLGKFHSSYCLPPSHLYVVCLFLLKYYDFGITKIGKLRVFLNASGFDACAKCFDASAEIKVSIKICQFFNGLTNFFGKMYCLCFIMTHGLESRDRNGSGCAFTPQSQPDPTPFRNGSTAITSRGGRLVPERPDAVEQV